MKYTSLIIFLFCFFIHQNCFSQLSPDEIIQDFFSIFKEKGSSAALDSLYGTNKWMNRSQDAIVNLKSQMEGLNKDYVGTYFGEERLTEKWLGTSYVLISYMVKYERQPIRFTFQFYKPKDKWMIYIFQYDSNIDDEVEEAAKAYYLNLSKKDGND